MDLTIRGARILATFRLPLLGTVHLTQTVIISIFVLFFIAFLCFFFSFNLKTEPISRRQILAEWAVSALSNLVRTNMGPSFDRYLPLLASLFASSVVSNLVSLLGLWSPTADLMTELGWALVVFLLITYHKLRSSGFFGYFKNFFRPFFLLAPINMLAELFIPISLACRHFGNILSGTVITALIYAALTVASNWLLGGLSSNLFSPIILAVIGLFLLFFTRKKEKKFWFVLGCLLAFLGVAALLHGLGGVFATLPFLAVGLPALTSFYFDWFGGCVQAFIFCTLTTLFIKQAAET